MLVNVWRDGKWIGGGAGMAREDTDGGEKIVLHCIPLRRAAGMFDGSSSLVGGILEEGGGVVVAVGVEGN